MPTERKTAAAFLKRLDDKGSGEAVIATLNTVDKDGDFTLPGAFGEPVVPFLVSHQWSQVPAGKAWIREEGNEARASFQLNLATSLGKDLYEAMRFDLSHPPAKMEMSYGFSIPPGGSEFQTVDGQHVRVLKHLQVHEVSSVVLGSGIGTRLVAVKGVSADREELLAYLQGLPRERQEAWLTEVQALCTEARVLLLDIAFDDLLAEPKGSYAFRYAFTTLPVEDPRRRAATAGLIAAAAELRSREPSFRFFREAMPGEQFDFISSHPLVGASNISAHPGVVAVHEKLSPAETLETIAHEVVHFARPGLPEAKVEEFGRELAREHDHRPALVPVPVFISAEEARELRKHQTIHYSPILNAEFVLALRSVPTRSPQPNAVGKAVSAFDRLSPLSGRPSPTA